LPDSNTFLTSSQKFFKHYVDKFGPAAAILQRFLPKFGLSDLLEKVDDPCELHEELYKVKQTIDRLLQEDHDFGIVGCSCTEIQPIDLTTLGEESSTGVLRGDDRIGEVHPDGNPHVELHPSVQLAKEPGEDTSSRHEAKVYGGVGTQRSLDEIDW
jgi:hypothetical protein